MKENIQLEQTKTRDFHNFNATFDINNKYTFLLVIISYDEEKKDVNARRK